MTWPSVSNRLVDHNGVPDWAIIGPLKVSLEAATKKHKDLP